MALMALTVPDGSITAAKMSASNGTWLGNNLGIYRTEGNVGIGTEPRAQDRLRVNGNIRYGATLFLKDDGDNAHGLAWNAKPLDWAPAPAATIDGPVLFGWRGGALASVETKNMALQWNAGGVQISGNGSNTWNYPTGPHVGITSNSIYAKSNATAMTTLALSPGGGGVTMGATNFDHIHSLANRIQGRNAAYNPGALALNPDGGNIFIGTAESTAYVFANVQILGKGGYDLPAHTAYTSGGQAGGGTGAHLDIGLKVDSQIVANAFRAISDARIKKVAGRSDAAADLRTLGSLEITDYQFIDAAANGAQPQKKVIAQQIEKVYPQAVARTTGVIPDILRKAPLADGWVMLDTDLKAGETVKLVGKTEDKITEVKEVRPGAFRPAEAPPGDEVLVYGREVHDFRSVDYDAIAMLNVSATQELARRMMEKDEKIAALEKRLTEIEGAETRLAALEKSVAVLVSTAQSAPAPTRQETAAVR